MDKRRKSPRRTAKRSKNSNEDSHKISERQPGCLLSDLLYLFETGQMHDCTFQVGPVSGLKMDFKCHKMILSVASDVFQAMLYGNSKEGKLNPDKPIPLFDTDPQVFDCAMRFLYGRVKEFKSATFATQVYKFADKMQISSLTKELANYFEEEINKASQVFVIFDLYVNTHNQQGRDSCKEILSTETPEAVGSEAWLSVSFKTVQAFLRMNCLGIEEADLVRALLRWARFQLQKDGDNPNDCQKLRDKILPGLHLIRFSAVSHVQFARLCLDGLEEVLSGDEKHSIMMFIVTEDWKQMPAQIAPTKLAPRQKPYTVFHLKPKSSAPQQHLESIRNRRNSFTTTLRFQIDKDATFAGLAVEGPLNVLQNLSIDLIDSEAGISSRGIFYLKGADFFKIIPEVYLSANMWYNLTFTGESPPSCTYSFQNSHKPLSSDGLMLMIGSHTIGMNVQKMMFRPLNSAA